MTRPAKFLIPLVLAAGLFYFLFQVRGMLFPFILAMAFAYLLNPLISYFEMRGFRRNVVVLGLYTVLSILLASGIYLGVSALSREAAKARAEMPLYNQRVAKLMQAMKEVRSGSREWKSPILQRLQPLRRVPFSQAILEHLDRCWPAWSDSLLEQVPSVVLNIFPLLEILILVPFIAFFFMVGGPSLLEALLDRVPARYVEMVLNLIVETDNSLGNYLRGLLLEAFLVGLFSLVGFWLIGFDYAFRVSLLIGAGNVIPYLGPVAGAAVGGILALFQWGTVGGLVRVWTVCAVVKFLDDWIFQSWILKKAVNLHPVIILFAMMSGAALWGFWGLLFAVPAACMAKVALEVGWEWYNSEFGIRLPEVPPEIHRVPQV